MAVLALSWSTFCHSHARLLDPLALPPTRSPPTPDGRPAMMPNWDKDYAAGRAILEHYGLPVFECPLHLEGGSIHSDGQG